MSINWTISQWMIQNSVFSIIIPVRLKQYRTSSYVVYLEPTNYIHPLIPIRFSFPKGILSKELGIMEFTKKKHPKSYHIQTAPIILWILMPQRFIPWPPNMEAKGRFPPAVHFKTFEWVVLLPVARVTVVEWTTSTHLESGF